MEIGFFVSLIAFAIECLVFAITMIWVVARSRSSAKTFTPKLWWSVLVSAAASAVTLLFCVRYVFRDPPDYSWMSVAAISVALPLITVAIARAVRR